MWVWVGGRNNNLRNKELLYYVIPKDRVANKMVKYHK